MARATVYKRSVHANVLNIGEGVEHRTAQNTIGNIVKIKEEPPSELECDDYEFVSKFPFDGHHKNKKLSLRRNTISGQHKDTGASISNQETLQKDVDVSKAQTEYQNDKENQYGSRNSDQFMYEGLCILTAEFEDELEKTLANLTKGNRDLHRKRKFVKTSIRNEQDDCDNGRSKRRKTRSDDLSDNDSEKAPFQKLQNALYNQEREKRSSRNFDVAAATKKLSKRNTTIKNKKLLCFKCITCGLTFATPLQLKHHKKHYSLSENCVVCDICNMTFGWQYQLVNHKRSAHSAVVDQKLYKFVCIHCNQGFHKKTGIQAHLKHYHNDRSIFTLITTNRNECNKKSFPTELLADSDGVDYLLAQNIGSTLEQEQGETSARLEDHEREASEQLSETDDTSKKQHANTNKKQTDTVRSFEENLSDVNRHQNTSNTHSAPIFVVEPNVPDMIGPHNLLTDTNKALDKDELCAIVPSAVDFGIVDPNEQFTTDDRAQGVNETDLNDVFGNIPKCQDGVSLENLQSTNEENGDAIQGVTKKQKQHMTVPGLEKKAIDKIHQRDDITPRSEDQMPINQLGDECNVNHVEDRSLSQNVEPAILSSNYSTQEEIISCKLDGNSTLGTNKPGTQRIFPVDNLNREEPLELKDDREVTWNGELVDRMLIDSNERKTIGLDKNDRDTRFKSHSTISTFRQEACLSHNFYWDKIVDGNQKGEQKYIKDHKTSQNTAVCVLNDLNQEQANEIQLQFGNQVEKPDDHLPSSIYSIEEVDREDVEKILADPEEERLRNQLLDVHESEDKECALSGTTEKSMRALEYLGKICLEFQAEGKEDIRSEERPKGQSIDEETISALKYHSDHKLKYKDSEIISAIECHEVSEVRDPSVNSVVKHHFWVGEGDTSANASEKRVGGELAGQETKSAQDDISRTQSITISFPEAMHLNNDGQDKSTKLDNSEMQNGVRPMIHDLPRDQNAGNTAVTVPSYSASYGLPLIKDQLCSDHNRLEGETSKSIESTSAETLAQFNHAGSGSYMKCKEISIHLMRIDEFLRSYTPSIVSPKTREMKDDNLGTVSPDTKHSVPNTISAIERLDHRSHLLEGDPKENEINFKVVSIPLVRLEDMKSSCVEAVSHKIPEDSGKSGVMNLKNSHECGICSKTFVSEEVFKKHVKWAHSQFVCNICGEQLTKKARVVAHYLLRHTESGSNRCCVCGKSCVHFQNLKKHLSLHCNSKIGAQLSIQQCLNCKKKFRSLFELKMHSRLCSSSARMHACDSCGKIFGGASRLQEHQQFCNVANGKVIKLKDPLFSPEHCETNSIIRNEFVQEGEISHPNRSRSVMMTDCSEDRAMRKGSVTAYVGSERKNDDSRNHVCDVCKRNFRLKHHLKRHFLMKHTNIRYHNCENCHKGFLWKSQLLAHACNKKRIKLLGDEKDHKQAETKNHATSENTDANGRNNAAFKHHFAQHYNDARSHWCEKCGKGFLSNNNMLEHTCEIYRHRTNNQCEKAKTLRMEKEHYQAGTENNAAFVNADANGRSGGNLQKKVSFEFAWNANVLLKNHRGQGTYTCRLCNVENEALKNFKNHFTQHYKDSRCIWCENCGEGFLSSSNMLMHACNFNTNSMAYQCKICGQRFNQSFNLRRHILHFSNDGDYICEFCGSRFSSKYRVECHIRAAHNPDTADKYKFRCRACNEGFQTKNALEKHTMHYHMQQTFIEVDSTTGLELQYMEEKESHDVHPYVSQSLKCEVCNVQFENCESYDEHMTFYSNEKDFICSICGIVFTGEYLLDYHTKAEHETETTRNSYALHCDICKQGFIDLSGLRAHAMHCHNVTIYDTRTLQNSNGDRLQNVKQTLEFGHSTNAGFDSHECDVCGMDFASASFLAMHKDVYSNDGDFQCDKCGRRCRTISLLDEHMLTVHTGSNDNLKYKCEICGELSITEISWRAHQKHFHDNQNAKIVESTLEDINKTIRTHQEPVMLDMMNNLAIFKPNVNSEIDSTAANSNIINDDVSVIKCVTCGQKFPKLMDLKNHLLEYSNNGKCVCSLCNRRCFTRFRLNQHKKKHLRSNQIYYKFRCATCSEGFTKVKALDAHEAHFHGPQIVTSNNSASAPITSNGNTELETRSYSVGHNAHSLVSGAVKTEIEEELNDHELLLTRSNDSNLKEKPVPSSSIVIAEKKAKTKVDSKKIKSTSSTKKLTQRKNANTVFKCGICQREFGSKKNLSKHLSKYSNEGNYVCELCNMRFPWSTLLDYHKSKHAHKSSNWRLKFTCEICSEKFRDSHALRAHMSHYHAEQMKARNSEKSQGHVEDRPCIENRLAPIIQNDHELGFHNQENVNYASESHSTSNSGGPNITTNNHAADLSQICVGEAYHVKNDGEECSDPLAIGSNYKEELNTESNGSTEAANSHHRSIDALTSSSSCDASDKESVPNLKEQLSLLERPDPRMTDRSETTEFACLICKEIFCNVTQFMAHFVNSHAEGRQVPLKNDGDRRAERKVSNQFLHDSSGKFSYAITEHCAKVIRAFKCNVCNEIFATRGLLTKHRYLCSAESSFMCDICEVKFNSFRRLEMHKQLIHNILLSSESEELFSCPYCSLSFAAESNVDAHVNDAHSKAHESLKDIVKIENIEDDFGLGEVLPQLENQSSTDASKFTSILVPVMADSIESTLTVTNESISDARERKQVGTLKVKSFAKIIENLTEATIRGALGSSREEDRTLQDTKSRRNNELKDPRYVPVTVYNSDDLNMIAQYVAGKGKVKITRKLTGSINESVNPNIIAHHAADYGKQSVTKESGEYIKESVNSNKITNRVASAAEMNVMNGLKNSVNETVSERMIKHFFKNKGKINTTFTLRESTNKLSKANAIARYVANKGKLNLIRKFGESSKSKNSHCFDSSMIQRDNSIAVNEAASSGQKSLNSSVATEKQSMSNCAEEHIYRLVVPDEALSDQADFDVEYVETLRSLDPSSQNLASTNDFVDIEAHVEQLEVLGSSDSSTIITVNPNSAASGLNKSQAGISNGRKFSRKTLTFDGNLQLSPTALSLNKMAQKQSNEMQVRVKACEQILTMRKVHVCTFCNSRFSKRAELTQHWKICGSMFRNNGASHERVSEDASLTCQVCSRAFFVKEALYLHLASHNYCHQCKEILPPKVNLQDHLHEHTSTQGMKCGLCMMEFDSISKVTKHFKAMHCSFSCSVCAAKFISKPVLLSHMLSHSKRRSDQPVFCSKCKMAFVGGSDLAVHYSTCDQS